MNKAAVVTEFGQPLQIAEIELREIGPREVLVRLEMAAVCITDYYAARGGSTRSVPPFITGHAATGVVEEVGSGVVTVEPGDQVAITGTTECGVCDFCLKGTPGACAEVFEQGPRVIGRTTEGLEVKVEGGIGVYLQRNIYREGTIVKLEPGTPPEHAALFGCGIPSGLGAVLVVAETNAGSSVAISGAGHLGLWMLQGAKVAGASQIIVVEPDPVRRALAAELGATDTVDPTDGDVVELVKALTDRGRGVDFGFEAVGSAEAMEQSFNYTRNGGTFVPTGMRSRSENVSLNVVDFSIRAKRILSSQTGGGFIHRDIPRWQRLLQEGRVDASKIVSRVFPLEQINEAFAAARDRDVVTGLIDLR
jgi:S-(hydroxymethyl)glutathione dehydrogenase/alcohol dehydrogenase